MIYRILADGVVLLHGLYILFVVFGALLTFRWRWMPWLHLPAALWGAVVELGGWVCPLTPLENSLRRTGGAAGYGGGFIERYLVPLIYPGTLTREIQIALGVAVVVLNAGLYWWVVWRGRTGAVPEKAGDGGG